MTIKRSASKSLHWHPIHHNDVILFAGLLTPLQLGYWLMIRCHAYAGECRPLPLSRIARILRVPADDPELLEVLHSDYGFEETGEGWIIPELMEQHRKAAQDVERKREIGGRGGRARVEKARQAAISGTAAPETPQAPAVPVPFVDDDPEDF